MWWLFLAISLATVAMLVVNTIQIGKVDTGVGTVQAARVEATTRVLDTESLLLRRADGVKIPKRPYWVNIAAVKDKPNAIYAKNVDTTDYWLFHNDIEKKRITHFYRPDKNVVFKIENFKLENDSVARTLIEISNSNGESFGDVEVDAVITLVGLPTGPDG